MNDDEYMTFDQWWRTAGSGITPNSNDDMETHARHVASIVWKAAQAVLSRAIHKKNRG